LGIKCPEFILFYDWDSFSFIEKIEVIATDIFWNSKLGKVVVSSKEKIYHISYNKQILQDRIIPRYEAISKRLFLSNIAQFIMHINIEEGIPAPTTTHRY